MKTKRIWAWLLTLTMIMTSLSGFEITVSAEEEVTVVQSDTQENTNQAGGIVYTKTSTAKSDGTIDITLTAHTTGVVRQLTSVQPTDIVLVLDVSGSMGDSYTTTRITGYNEATGSQYTYSTGLLWWREEHTCYGFQSTSTVRYINTGTQSEPIYTRVTRTGRDANGFDMYEYSVGNQEVIVYPVLSGTISAQRENSSYDIVQFYTATTSRQTVDKMESLRTAVNTFIDTTVQMNQGLEEDQMHNISIVKFANENYYQSNTTTIVEGNNSGYSQVVKNLIPVDEDGATELKNAVAAISPYGATAVDYGLSLAEAVLMNRSQVVAENAVDRNEVIIVFSDGSPTYNNSFEQSVANNAINIANRMKTEAGVTIYGVCIDANADAADLDENINKFMHYISSNYPNAQSMSSSESGCDISAGYYKTIDDNHTLSMLFEAIIQDIDHPTVTLGEEATMVDTISPYFDFQNGAATNVVLQTSERIPDGNGGFTWETPIDDDSIKAVISGDRLTVNGFDFDENYVSETGRGDNGDFYGKRLVVSFTVVPDYDVIDIASATLMGGIIHTNSGFASLVDSDAAPQAEVATPELSAHQVTYMVGEDEYATYNRFKGSDVEVDAVPVKEGYKFSGWKIDGEPVEPGDIFEMPNEDVEIVGTFTANTYNITYQYSGQQLVGAPDLPDATTAQYQDIVEVEDSLTLQGYVFKGWYPLQTDVTVTEGTFTMPAKDVTLVGYFESSSATPYKVEHYLETLTDGVYEETPALVEDTFAGTTGHMVSATPLNRFTGFEYNAETSADTISGEIKPDGSLVLKVYYDRIEYTVTYNYDGDTQIDNLPEKPQGGTFKYGQTVTVAERVTPPAGYTFTGWYRGTADNPVSGTFTMPAYNVNLLGFFTANTSTQYKVRHYLMGTNGEYPDDPEVEETFEGKTGTEVEAKPLTTFDGFTYNDTESALTKTGTITGDGKLVLELYYDRNDWQVTYEYEGNVPDGAPEEPTGETYVFGEEVDVADPVSEDDAPDGYTFVGWYRGEVTNIVESFEMPNRNVVLRGYFVPDDNTPYKVEHYLMDIDGEYPDEPEVEETFYGTTDNEVEAKPLTTFDGFTYNDTESALTKTGTITGDGELVLKLYYDRNDWQVTYEYEGNVPDGAPEEPTGETYVFGEEVDVADPVSEEDAPDGYTFVGWYRGEVTNIVESFEMPNRNVVLRGYFKPNENTPYEIHHYLETLTDGIYESEPELIEDQFSGTTGHTVTATPLNRFTGFTYNEAESAGTISGQIKGDGSLVLEVYYDRIPHIVTYGYDGDIPDGAPAYPGEETYVYGAPVTVADPVSEDDTPDGYTFVGWYRGTQDNPVSGTFDMPNFNVHILGNFVAKKDTPYTIKHWLERADGSGYDLDNREVRHGETDTQVGALPREYPGFEYQPSLSTASGIIEGDGGLVLEFYYNRNLHNVTYQYEGVTPAGTPNLPDAHMDVRFGETVEVKDTPDIPGYTFIGWYDGADNNIVTSFAMPDRDVILKGKFQSNLVDYTVNFWLQNAEDDEYTLLEDEDGTGYTYKEQAYVGQLVQSRNQTFTGFSLRPDSVWQDYVTVDEHGVGNLVLNLYFDRHTYNVTYGYYGEQPAGAPVLTDRNLENVRYGTVLDVETKPELSGYSFDGWYTRTATVENNQFTMPDHDVAFLGRFVEQFTVSYDLKGGTGAEGVDYSTQVVDAGTEITVKDAPTRSGYTFEGWEEVANTFNPGDTVIVDRNIIFAAKWSYNGGGGGGGGRNYTLTYETNGGSEIKKGTYRSGTTVKLTKVPLKEGYVFEGWHLDEALTEDVTEVKMTKDITVYASWVEDNGGAGIGYDTPGSLNNEDHFAYVVGYPDGTVKPEANILRSETAAIFFRLLKAEIRDGNLSKENAFSDVTADDWFNSSVSTLSKLGIVAGKTENTFDPNAFITRAEFAAICARFDNSEFEVIDTFTDVSGHWAEDEIHEAAAHGWIKGYEDNTFRPNQYITRAEAMSMINRVLNRIPETADDLRDDMIQWPDNQDKTKWYYLTVQEATNSHDFEMKNHVYEKWTAIREVTDWAKYN